MKTLSFITMTSSQSKRSSENSSPMFDVLGVQTFRVSPLAKPATAFKFSRRGSTSCGESLPPIPAGRSCLGYPLLVICVMCNGVEVEGQFIGAKTLAEQSRLNIDI